MLGLIGDPHPSEEPTHCSFPKGGVGQFHPASAVCGVGPLFHDTTELLPGADRGLFRRGCQILMILLECKTENCDCAKVPRQLSKASIIIIPPLPLQRIDTGGRLVGISTPAAVTHVHPC